MQAPLRDKNDIKIFILYLLKNFNYPLDFNTISDMVIQDEFVNYFDFAECFSELLDSGNIEQIMVEANRGRKTDFYRITDTGIHVVEQLHSNLMNVIKEKSLKSAMRLLSFKSRGSEVHCSSSERNDGRYDLTCSVAERGEPILSLNMIVDSKYQLDKMIHNYNERPEVIYRGIIALLMGDINYLID